MRQSLAIAATTLCFSFPAFAETPEEWSKLGARVHGGYGAFIPLGVRIGLDAVQRLKAVPRSLNVTYRDNAKAPCACFADGVAIATRSSVGQRSLLISPQPAPATDAAVIEVRPKTGGAGIRYTIPMAALPRLAEMNRTMKEIERHEAVMNADGLFTSEEMP